MSLLSPLLNVADVCIIYCLKPHLIRSFNLATNVDPRQPSKLKFAAEELNTYQAGCRSLSYSAYTRARCRDANRRRAATTRNMPDKAAATPSLIGVIVQSPMIEATHPSSHDDPSSDQGRSITNSTDTRPWPDEDKTWLKMEKGSLAPASRAAESFPPNSALGARQGRSDQAHSLMGVNGSQNGSAVDPCLNVVSLAAITAGASTPDPKSPMAISVRRKPVHVRHSRSPLSPGQYSDLPEVVPSESIQSSSPQLPEAVPGTNLSRLVSDLPEVAKPSAGGQSDRLQDVIRGPPAKSKARNASTTSQARTASSDDQTLASRKPTGSGPQPVFLDRKVPQTTESQSMMVAQEVDVQFIDQPDVDGFPLLVRAALDDQLEVVRTLLTKGASIEARHATSGRTALMEASSMGQVRMVELLVEHGCFLHALDTESNSALHLAAANGDVSLTKYLLDRGAAVDIKGREDKTPLHVALRHPYVINLLLHRQANVHARSSAQRTPLHMSAAAGLAVTCDVLINLYGAQLDARDSDSKTPLQVAVDAGHLKIVTMLLARMNLKPKDPTFMAALFAAIETGNAKMVEAFFERGASLKRLGDKSYKAATLTGKSGSPAMLELMISKKCKLKEVRTIREPSDLIENRTRRTGRLTP